MTKELSQDEKDQIESYIYKAPPEIQSVMRKDIEFGYTLGLQSAEKEIERLKGLIEQAHYIGYKDGTYQGEGRYTSSQSFILFKVENNF